MRESTNVEHRRGSSGGGLALKGGIGTIIMALIAIFVFKQPVNQVLSNMVQEGGTTQSGEARPQDAETEKFVRAMVGSTEDVWTKIFAQNNQRYPPPKVVDYDGSTRMRTGGVADSRMGPFYLPAEQTVYLDIAFFEEMKRSLGGGGQFAYAYVLAHEVGHHIQHLTGFTKKVHGQKGRVSQREYNQLSVRLELQADYLAGVWAHHADRKRRQETGQGLLEDGDIEDAMRAAKAIGDDALQRQAGGRVVEDSFTHGTSEQRLRWFTAGLRSGRIDQLSIFFEMPYENL